MKKIYLSLLVALTVLLASCSTTDSDKLSVTVSIVPQKAIVEAIAGDLVDVVVAIPPGYSPANYDPSPTDMVKIMSSEVYFTIGVPTEAGNILGEIGDLTVVHLEELVGDVYEDLMFEDDHHDDDHEGEEHDDDHEGEEHDDDHEGEEHDDHDDHDHSGRDPHIWLSIKRVILMTEIIRDQLIELDPDNEDTYTTNAAAFISDLQDLDEEVEAMFEGLTMRTFIIYHPSFGYFADDYGLTMLELEEGGKDATSQNLTEVIDFARDNNIDTVFYQSEISSAQVDSFADEVNATKVQLNPLSGDYINNYRTFAQAIKDALVNE